MRWQLNDLARLLDERPRAAAMAESGLWLRSAVRTLEFSAQVCGFGTWGIAVAIGADEPRF
jgi:hypothetical protein